MMLKYVQFDHCEKQPICIFYIIWYMYIHSNMHVHMYMRVSVCVCVCVCVTPTFLDERVYLSNSDDVSQHVTKPLGINEVQVTQ